MRGALTLVGCVLVLLFMKFVALSLLLAALYATGAIWRAIVG